MSDAITPSSEHALELHYAAAATDPQRTQPHLQQLTQPHLRIPQPMEDRHLTNGRKTCNDVLFTSEENMQRCVFTSCLHSYCRKRRRHSQLRAHTRASVLKAAMQLTPRSRLQRQLIQPPEGRRLIGIGCGQAKETHLASG